ncbi:hypothetical protein [Rhodoplanes sp. SY1]|uniref:hypothetical protein n=1 Tax=Rhodoplanes sp. SY1 TaxID=3166646 RepID=UPI0038B47E35
MIDARAAESAFTMLEGGVCKIRASEEFASMECRGPSGYSARLSDEGILVAVGFSLRGKWLTIDENLEWRGGTDRWYGDALEWRTEGGRPYAAILQTWRSEEDLVTGKDVDRHEFLVIRIANDTACSIARVPASRQGAEQIARNLADTVARQLHCGSERGKTSRPQGMKIADCGLCIPVTIHRLSRIGPSYVRIEGKVTKQDAEAFCSWDIHHRARPDPECIRREFQSEGGRTHWAEANCTEKLVRTNNGKLLWYSPAAKQVEDSSQHWVDLETGERSCDGRNCPGVEARYDFDLMCPGIIEWPERRPRALTIGTSSSR